MEIIKNIYFKKKSKIRSKLHININIRLYSSYLATVTFYVTTFTFQVALHRILKKTDNFKINFENLVKLLFFSYSLQL